MSEPEQNRVYRKPTLEKKPQAVAEKPVQPQPTKSDLIKEVLTRAPSLVKVQHNAWLYSEWLAELTRAVEAA